MTRTSRIFGTLVLSSVSLVLLVNAISFAQKKDVQPKEPEVTVMQRKLIHSQKILEGLAKSDFTLMDSSADELLKCINDATWKINDTEKYLAHSEQFRREINDLKKASGKKNLEAAALAYTDMTRSCVRCHQHLRENQP